MTRRYVVTLTVERSVVVDARDAEHAATRAIAVTRNGQPDAVVAVVAVVQA